jgi:RimJ/RimL family protein N-acetyltransferase
MSLILETTRLNLRAFQNSDTARFAEYRSDPEVAKYQSWETPYTVRQASKFIADNEVVHPGTPGEWYQIAIERKDSRQLIGDCAFHVLAEDPKQVEIGFTLSANFQGQGIATEAVKKLIDYLFGELLLHRISAICDSENSASRKLLEKVGMRQEAHFIENIWFKGKWGSEYAYGLLRNEWSKSAG